MIILGYQIFEEIYESALSLVYRGCREQDEQPVILKVLKPEYPTPEAIARYKLEYEIARNLNLEGVVRAYSLEKYRNSLVMILEDFGGKSLKTVMNSQTFTLEEFLALSLQIVDILGEIHQQNIIHKDINPSNIVFNPETGQIKIIDFGISTVLSRENPTIRNPNGLEGTLAYMSPEQTGRMNRAIDYRTDFYSLGATFYELLVNQLPFNTGDAMELVHCHIAKQPIPPKDVINRLSINREIPPALSDIVMKLLAKTAEERYQSAWGIKADLEECLNQLQKKRKIEDFPLGRYDISDKFQIPQKLYGRKLEREILLAAMDRVSQGKSEMMLVSGYSGIGKSALVQEIYQPITRSRGYFISGKFDQFQGNIPYISLIQAFQELIRQLLTESESQIATWQEKLIATLGVNAQVIIDVIPDVELIVGKQPAVPELAPIESQNRFNLLFQNFISIFTKPEHPLAIFLDDLQWADSASLKLIQLLMTQPNSQYLLLIGAYRDNEVSSAHPLMLTIDEIQKAAAVVNHVSLVPLELATVNHLIADTLNCSIERALPLAELVYQKTNGNPFFMNEFLKTLYTENLLNFNFNLVCWQWNFERLQAAPIAENVVELMASKIQKLSNSTQKVLKLAACIGNQFDLKTLSIVHEKSQSETANELWEAVREGLILPIGNDYKLLQAYVETRFLEDSGFLPQYKFVHDRVQQAAYSLIPASHKQKLHLQIGQLLLKNTALAARDEKIFDIVNQLNCGIPLLHTLYQRDELAKLNLIAGKKAKVSNAYQPAFNYLKLGLNLLEKKSWETQYTTTLALYVEAAEVAYLCGQFDEMERLVSVVLKNATLLLDKVKVYEVKIAGCIAQHKLLEAVDTGLTVLNLLGVRLPKKPGKLDILVSLMGTKLVLLGKPIENLIHLPEMTDPDKLAALRILASISAAIYNAAPNLVPLACFKGINLSIKYGNSSISPVMYASYSLVLCGVLGDIESGYKFGNLALSLLERLNAKKQKAKTVYIVNSFVRHWREHGRQTLQLFLENYSSSIETGDLEFAGYSANLYSFYSYCIGQELPFVEQEAAKYSNSAIQQLKQERKFYSINLNRQMALNLMGKSENPSRLIGEAYDESKRIPLDVEGNDRYALFNVYAYKLILCYLFRESKEALENSIIAERYLDSVMGTLSVPMFHLYDSLVRLAVYASASKFHQKSLLKKVENNQKKMKKWAHSAPMNHLHKFYLVEAEKHRVFGREVNAMDSYDRAIALAKEHEYIHEEALAHELAAKFYLEKRRDAIAQVYMQNARYCYLRWGATAKVKDLEGQYPQLLRKSEASIAAINTTTTATLSSASGSTGSDALDLTTVMKASQALSGEIVLDRLLAKLMKILIENAGAQKGFLILETKGKLLIEAEGTADGDFLQDSFASRITVLQSLPLENVLPASIINYVARTKESLVFDEAAREIQNPHSHLPHLNDSYIKEHKPKSVLCAPLVNQGKVAGILYLENNLTAGAFTTERLEVLNLLSSQAAISIENARLYTNMAELNVAYERFVPREFLQFLDKESIVDVELGDQVQMEMSVLFSDIRSFTTLSETMTPQENFKFINSYLRRMEPAITENNGFIDKYIGDAIMALFGGRGSHSNNAGNRNHFDSRSSADDALKAAIAMLHRLAEYNQHRIKCGYIPIQNGIGINTGSLMLGTVGGYNRMNGTVISDAVNLASRVESLTKNYGVSLLITHQTFSRLKNSNDYSIRTIDTVKVKGKSEAVTVYEVFDADLPEIREGKLATARLFREALSFYNLQNFGKAEQILQYCLQQNPMDTVAQIYLERCQPRTHSEFRA